MNKYRGSRTLDYLKFYLSYGIAITNLAKTGVYKYIHDLIC